MIRSPRVQDTAGRRRKCRRGVPRRSCREAHRVVLKKAEGMRRRRNGPQIRKIQEKGDAVKRLQLSEHQGPAEELREGPGNLSGHKEGPGGGGTPQDGRISQSSKEGPP